VNLIRYGTHTYWMSVERNQIRTRVLRSYLTSLPALSIYLSHTIPAQVQKPAGNTHQSVKTKQGNIIAQHLRKTIALISFVHCFNKTSHIYKKKHKTSHKYEKQENSMHI
jgi:hypothetical protein